MIVHAIAPVHDDEALTMCYKNCLELVLVHKIRSIVSVQLFLPKCELDSQLY